MSCAGAETEHGLSGHDTKRDGTSADEESTAQAIATGNHVFFPPENDSRSRIVDYVVHAGDLLNITWATSWSSIDLRIDASMAQSNFTVTPFFNPGLAGTGFFPYRLQPHDYLTNNTIGDILAFFQLSDHSDSSEFVRTQNFSIAQPNRPSQVDDAGIPLAAQTWTGSVTLVTSAGSTHLATFVPPGATNGAVTPPDEGSGPVTGLATAPAVSATPTASPSPVPTAAPAGELTTSARIGIGAGITAALALLLVAALLCARRGRATAARRRSPDVSQMSCPKPADLIYFNHETNTWSRVPHVVKYQVEKPAWQHLSGGDLGSRNGHHEYDYEKGLETENGPTTCNELPDNRPFFSEMPDNKRLEPQEMSAGPWSVVVSELPDRASRRPSLQPEQIGLK